MGKLYELTGAYARLAELDEEVIDPETGEVTRPFEAALAELEDAIEHKVDGCAKVLKQLEADEEMLKAEEARLYARRKSAEARHKRLKDYVRENLKIAGKDKVKTLMFTVYLSAAKQKVDVFDESLIPDDLRAEAKKPPPDKKAIEQAIKGGRDVQGARLVMGEQPLTVR